MHWRVSNTLTTLAESLETSFFTAVIFGVMLAMIFEICINAVIYTTLPEKSNIFQGIVSLNLRLITL